MERLGQRDGRHGRLAPLLRQVDDARPERHPDLDERLIAVGEQVLGLARVDAHDAEQQVAGRAQRELHARLDDRLHAAADVRLEDVRLSQLAVPVSGKPDARQRALLAEHKVRVEHRDGDGGGDGRLTLRLRRRSPPAAAAGAVRRARHGCDNTADSDNALLYFVVLSKLG